MKRIVWVLAALFAGLTAKAQVMTPTESLWLNDEITTFIVNNENIKMIDISASDTLVVGNQPGENIARLKAVRKLEDGARMGVVTVIGERNISQFTLYYAADKQRATTEYRVRQADLDNYTNPAVEMDLQTMYRYCWTIWDSKKKFFNLSNRESRLTIRLNNLYTVGNYFFFDISVENDSNIQFDIDEIRIKLVDKKQAKATSSQEIELIPELEMRPVRQFKKSYRNIFVLRKLTFPDEKVLSFSMSEKPISGRTITLRVDYSDVLRADGFSNSLKMK